MTWRSKIDRWGRGSALVLSLGAAGLSRPAQAQVTTPLPGAYAEWYEAKNREEDAPPREFVLINYFFSRATVTNGIADPAGLKGVTLGPFGLAAGSAVRVEPGRSAFYVEQRWIPVIEYSPFFMDGLASFRAQFEVDYLWGRAANASQQNEGGGFNADQVNIQTKNVNVALYPTRDANQLAIVVGTQPVYDAYFDPTRTPLNDIIRTGYKLAFLGSDATGLSFFRSYKGHARLSLLPLGSAQPDKALLDDPRLFYAVLGMADYAWSFAPGTNVGLSAWYLRDETKTLDQMLTFSRPVRGPAPTETNAVGLDFESRRRVAANEESEDAEGEDEDEDEDDRPVRKETRRDAVEDDEDEDEDDVNDRVDKRRRVADPDDEDDDDD